jgi:hypothetical protein
MWLCGQVVCPERLRETRGSRLPLRGVIRLWIGIGSLGNLDGMQGQLGHRDEDVELKNADSNLAG